MAISVTARSMGLLRHSSWDSLLIALSLAHAAVLIAAPSIFVIAIGLWWNANTISHNFIHLPFFRSRQLNLLYSIYLTLLLGLPQGLWRERHLRHHRGEHAAVRWARWSLVELGAVLTLWVVLAGFAPKLFVAVYLPGYLVGLGLCFLQGHFEHARGTTSHYGWLYNLCFFNDGYHIEHHSRPSEHWTQLPRWRVPKAGLKACATCSPHTHDSRWPPILRWLDAIGLEWLERLVVSSTWLQRLVLVAHERAFRALLPRLPTVRRVTVVGGGLFPRTALILKKLLPGASLTIVDISARNLEIARMFLSDEVEFCCRNYDPQAPDDADLVVIPLSFVGDRAFIYREPQARATLVHDWMWRSRGEGTRVSWLLLKRLNLVKQDIGRNC